MKARFTIVDMGSGKIALHNAKYNRLSPVVGSGWQKGGRAKTR